MSEVFFTDASEAPVPPSEVRIRALDARPRPDGVRVDVHVELTPFQQRPNIEVTIGNGAGRQVAALSVVEAIDNKMDFTMHLKEPQPSGAYRLAVQVFYSIIESQSQGNGGGQPATEILEKAKQMVDERSVTFETPMK